MFGCVRENTPIVKRQKEKAFSQEHFSSMCPWMTLFSASRTLCFTIAYISMRVYGCAWVCVLLCVKNRPRQRHNSGWPAYKEHKEHNTYTHTYVHTATRTYSIHTIHTHTFTYMHVYEALALFLLLLLCLYAAWKIVTLRIKQNAIKWI